MCGEKLLNSLMILSKLKWHISTNHDHFELKDHNYFKCSMIMQSKQVKFFEKKKVAVSDKFQIASYKIAQIAQKTKPHLIAESLILPTCSEIIKIIFGNKASNDISKYHYLVIRFEKELMICH